MEQINRGHYKVQKIDFSEVSIKQGVHNEEQKLGVKKKTKQQKKYL